MEALIAGARLFDDGRYWDAHEAWEERWRVETDERERKFVQALIQIAAALHKRHVTKDEAATARLFAKALAKLEAGPFRAAIEAAVDGSSVPRMVDLLAQRA